MGQPLAERVLQSMRDNLSRRLDLDELTRLSGYSTGRLRSLFKQQTGLTLKQAQAQLRLQESQRLLVHSSFQIRAIAQLVGFPNANKFNYFFRRSTGLTPGEFARAGQIPHDFFKLKDPAVPIDEVYVKSDATTKTTMTTRQSARATRKRRLARKR
jgi:AraC-like DNA-binding protein